MAKMQMQTGWKSPFKISENIGSLVFEKWTSPEAYSKNTDRQYQSKDSGGLPVELPIVYKTSEQQGLLFEKCEQPLGLYPIVDRADWLERLLPVGISTAQLRIKDLTGDALRKEIARAVNIAKQYKCQLFINDYWQLAIDCDAYGVHLGEEDIDAADLQAISDAGLRLGLSSHCFHEVARAKSIKPSYIAFGPVYETQTKDMPWVPQGPVGLKYWRQHFSGTPMVAIGGIHGDRFEAVEKTGIDGIAMITAITLAPDPVETAAQYRDRFLLHSI
jgi:hydroxymethylpyrimidine kinase/phosphomethylpyrimidine kinase/thiamine-phosphate diphosphorylase